VVDRDRVLAKLDELDGYLDELRAVTPRDLEEYARIEKRRSCERLLQLAVEATIDACAMLVTGLRLGLPGEENDLFEKLARRGVISGAMTETLRRMKGMRNILVHEYGRVDDALVFETVRDRLDDFGTFKREVLDFLRGL
jgi:uncharacterized protein YutE (UPF0331/DUF86 family)